MIIEVTTVTLGSLPLDQPSKSKPFTPMFSCTSVVELTSLNTGEPTGIPRRTPSGNGPGKRMTPAGAGGGRDAPARVDRQGRSRSGIRASPEMRPGSHVDWVAT